VPKILKAVNAPCPESWDMMPSVNYEWEIGNPLVWLHKMYGSNTDYFYFAVHCFTYQWHFYRF